MQKWTRLWSSLILVLLLAGCASGAAEVTALPLPLCSSLMAAVQAQDLAMTQSCIQAEQDVNMPDAKGLSPLNYAAAYGNIEIVEELIAAGADVNFQDPWGMSSLHAALKEGHEDVVIMLLEHGASVNLQTMAGSYVGFTPLHTAIYFGKVGTGTIEELLKRGANVDLTNQDGLTPLQMATEKGLTDVVELLIQYGAVN